MLSKIVCALVLSHGKLRARHIPISDVSKSLAVVSQSIHSRESTFKFANIQPITASISESICFRELLCPRDLSENQRTSVLRYAHAKTIVHPYHRIQVRLPNCCPSPEAFMSNCLSLPTILTPIYEVIHFPEHPCPNQHSIQLREHPCCPVFIPEL